MKLKRLMALGMAAVMTMSLTACGGSGDTPSTNSNTASNNNDSNAAADNDAAADDANAADDSAADDANAADDSAAEGGLTYGSITLGEDYTDLTASIKFIHHKTDREQDGSMAKYSPIEKDYHTNLKECKNDILFIAYRLSEPYYVLYQFKK